MIDLKCSADASMTDSSVTCRLCGSNSCSNVGSKKGLNEACFTLMRCLTCGYVFVGNPRTDYGSIYDEKYYRGEGADPTVDYMDELNNPGETVRRYEWDGILCAVKSLTDNLTGVKWLDFGCGNGGLVRAGLQAGMDIRGFEEGWIADQARGRGIPILNKCDLDDLAGTMDVVTAIEVLEHVVEPVATLHQIRTLLKPGGLFFATTGNAQKFRDELLSWSYVVPDVHVGFFEPNTLAEALRRSGFAPEWHGFLPGFADVIRFKVLKNLRIRSCGGWEKIIPWSLAARVVDYRYGVTAHPIGRAV